MRRSTYADSARDCATAQRGRLQPRLSALIAEVRALRRELELMLALYAMPDPREVMACRAQLLDQWIQQAQGRRQLVCLACAAEEGVLTRHHLELGQQTASTTSDRALRALYWASVQRWSRLPVAGQPRTSAPVVRRYTSNIVAADMCEKCCELRHDARRFAPHEALAPLAPLALEHDEMHRTDQAVTMSRYGCMACATRWVRRVLPWEPFVSWSVVQSDVASAATPPGPLHALTAMAVGKHSGLVPSSL
ncbi:hypothetical protein ACUXAV_001049 [Cupriavidus metallidurans]|uniref:hypothetical protein n=1 Tax=Cupriavidus TaxID=106589 RepID=UPI0004936B57|nr:hypothetical protein [Cupriavidus metallidurans]KWW37404.1 hypothetical protein AU374_01164 [Cupriavidus metallidurans]MDE4918939.1 hypothetical protein [Cupriavidus metallidurans]